MLRSPIEMLTRAMRIRKSLISSSPMEAPMRATPRIDTRRFCPLSSTEALLAAPPAPPEPTVGPEGPVLPPPQTVEGAEERRGGNEVVSTWNTWGWQYA